MISGTDKKCQKSSSTFNFGKSAKVKKLITKDCRVVTYDIAEPVEISHESAANIVRELGFATVCTRRVLRLDTIMPGLIPVAKVVK